MAGGHKGVKDARFDLLPVDALWQVDKVFGEGAKKYAERNWERGIPRSSQKGAIDRHMSLYWAGEDNDPETGLPHLAHVAWHALTMLALHLRRGELAIDECDDRVYYEALDTMAAEVTNPEDIKAAQAEVVTAYDGLRLVPRHRPEFDGEFVD